MIQKRLIQCNTFSILANGIQCTLGNLQNPGEQQIEDCALVVMKAVYCGVFRKREMFIPSVWHS